MGFLAKERNYLMGDGSFLPAGYKPNELVSMASMVATYLELDKASGSVMGVVPGYYIWDVSMNGKVEIPPVVPNYTQLPAMGKDEDAWIIYKTAIAILKSRKI
ncbi:MAG: hypothetical protein ACLU30_19370 [Odoribacter splanchnicus]